MTGEGISRADGKTTAELCDGISSRLGPWRFQASTGGYERSGFWNIDPYTYMFLEQDPPSRGASFVLSRTSRRRIDNGLCDHTAYFMDADSDLIHVVHLQVDIERVGENSAAIEAAVALAIVEGRAVPEVQDYLDFEDGLVMGYMDGVDPYDPA